MRLSPCNVYIHMPAFPNGNVRHDPCPSTDLAKTFSHWKRIVGEGIIDGYSYILKQLFFIN